MYKKIVGIFIAGIMFASVSKTAFDLIAAVTKSNPPPSFRECMTDIEDRSDYSVEDIDRLVDFCL